MGGFLPEGSPIGSSQSNGVAERAVRSVEEQVRVLRSGLEERIGTSIPEGHCIWAWLVEHAGVLLSRFKVGHDGKTGYEKQGKACHHDRNLVRRKVILEGCS